MTTDAARRPAGTPVGGQFSAMSRGEAEVQLDTDALTAGPVKVSESVDDMGARRVEIRDAATGCVTDGPDGAAGFQTYRPDGTRMHETHYRAGVLGNAISYHPDGITPDTITLRNEDGSLRGDGLNGAPAGERHFRPDGTILSEQHFHKNRSVDLADGTPSQRLFHPDGSVRLDLPKNGPGVEYPEGKTVVHADPRDGSLVASEGLGDGKRMISRGQPAEPGTYAGAIDGSAALVLRDGLGLEPAVRYLRADGTTSSTTSYPKGDGVMGVTTDYDANGDVVSVFACEGCDKKSTPCACHYGVDDITVNG